MGGCNTPEENARDLMREESEAAEYLLSIQVRREARNKAKTYVIKAMEAGVSAGSFHDLINSIEEMLKARRDDV
jgi:hypothetical protein